GPQPVNNEGRWHASGARPQQQRGGETHAALRRWRIASMATNTIAPNAGMNAPNEVSTSNMRAAGMVEKARAIPTVNSSVEPMTNNRDHKSAPQPATSSPERKATRPRAT